MKDVSISQAVNSAPVEWCDSLNRANPRGVLWVARFSEGHPDIQRPEYRADALPQTEAASLKLLTLPTFPSGETELLDQYVEALIRETLAYSQADESALYGEIETIFFGSRPRQ